MKRLKFAGVFIPLLLSNPVQAADFNGTTVRALGMGGSNVAATKGVDATFWNPAAYGFYGEKSDLDNNNMESNDFGIDLGGSASLSLFGSIADNLNILAGMNTPTGNAAAGFNNQEIVDAAKFISDFQSLDSAVGGVNASADALIGSRFGNYGVGVRSTLDVNASITFDNFNTGLGGQAVNAFTGGAGAVAGSGLQPSPGGYFTAADQDFLRASLTNNGFTADEAASMVFGYDSALVATNAPATSADIAQNKQAFITLSTAPGDINTNNTVIETRGILVKQAEVSYGHSVSDALSIGAVAKVMAADMVHETQKAFGATNTVSNTSSSSGADTDSAYGLDLGVMYRMEGMQFGATVKNVNTPKFTDATGYVYELKPQVKVGAAWIPTSAFTVEAGYDVGENEGVVPSSKSQYWNLGMEWNAFSVLALRLGAFENMSQDIGVVPTIGLGINMVAVRLDLAAAMSTKSVTVDGSDTPLFASASAALAIDF